MYVKEIRLRNIRGFHDAREVALDLTRPDGSLAGWTVLAGRNGSGKTSLLRAIALAVGGPAVARNLIPDFSSWVSVGKSTAEASVLLTRNPSFDQTSTAAVPFWVRLGWIVPNEASQGERLQPGIFHLRHQGEAQPAAVDGPWSDNPVGWLCAGYGPFRRLVGGSGEAQRLMLSRGPAARLASLFHEDASLGGGSGLAHRAAPALIGAAPRCRVAQAGRCATCSPARPRRESTNSRPA